MSDQYKNDSRSMPIQRHRSRVIFIGCIFINHSWADVIGCDGLPGSVAVPSLLYDERSW